MDVRTHRIGEIINKVLADPWPVDNKPEDGFTPARKGEMKTQKLWSWWGWGRRGPGKGKGGEDDDDGDDGWNKHGGVPTAEAEDDCVDCYKW